MDDVVIRTENISKKYVIGENVPYKALRDEITKLFTAPFRKAKNRAGLKKENGYIWAIKDVSFEIKKGEVVGIIGKNGAGKTTLLKILSRITEPTNGYAEVHGRVGSLLEVGTGFHPELTGRENIYLNGAILGMKKLDIDSRFDEIVTFAEVEKFIDTPVKRYSSGMYVRLAFAIAAHLEPEVLLVDEVLAVGDVAFQKKCLGKIKGVACEGRTVLFVSHNMGMISTLCKEAVLLKEGRVDFIGPPRQAIDRYLGNIIENAVLKKKWVFREAPGTEDVKIRSVAIIDKSGTEKLYFSTTEPIFVVIEYWVLNENIRVNVGFSLFDEHGNRICGVGNYKEVVEPIREKGLYKSKCTIPGNLLNSGRHTITVEGYLNVSDHRINVHHCIGFETVDDQRMHSTYVKWAGIIKPEFKWESERVGNLEEKLDYDVL